jgi:hypothetical protein
MIPYETDPTLHDHEPPRGLLDDGFSPPADEPAAAQPFEPPSAATGGAQVAPVARNS